MHFFRRILDFILPTSCSFCHDPVGNSNIPFFCSTCWADFTLIYGPVCQRCGRPFDSPETLAHSPDHVCLACRREPPLFDQALSVGYFEGSLREAVHQFKYRPCRTLGSPLGNWMAENVRLVTDIDLIMPVPLHVEQAQRAGLQPGAPSRAPDERNARYPVLLRQPVPYKAYQAAGGTDRSGADMECGRRFCDP